MIKNFFPPSNFETATRNDSGEDIINSLSNVTLLGRDNGLISVTVHHGKTIDDVIKVPYHGEFDRALARPLLTKLHQGKPFLFVAETGEPSSIQAVVQSLAKDTHPDYYPEMDIYLSAMHSTSRQVLIMVQNRHRQDLAFRRIICYTTTSTVLRLLLANRTFEHYHLSKINLHICMDNTLAMQKDEMILRQVPVKLLSGEKIDWAILIDRKSGFERTRLYLRLDTLDAPDTELHVPLNRRKIVYFQDSPDEYCGVLVTT